jgi:branched-chain amino acid transport system substrate-binding protein
MMMFRRAALRLIVGATAGTAGAGIGVSSAAADQAVKVGVDVLLTGVGAPRGALLRDAVLLAFEEANAAHTLPGATIEVVIYDDSTTGRYDPAQAAANARKMVADRQVVAVVGPQYSDAGKAMTPILSEGGLATITPGASNPDLTDPKFAAQYRPAGKPIFFRMVTTDAYQGPNLANYFKNALNMNSVFVLDDGSLYGVGTADAFQARAEQKGIKVLGRDRLDPRATEYTEVLRKVSQLSPDGLYYGGTQQAGGKLVKQAHEIIPNAIKGTGDSLVDRGILTTVGFPSLEGWYFTDAAPNLMAADKAQDFIKRYQAMFGLPPYNYAICAYDAALVIIDAMQRLTAAGTPVTREAMRDAIQSAKVETLQGLVSFDENGDLTDHTVSLYQVKKDPNHLLDDMRYQARYLGVAPPS